LILIKKNDKQQIVIYVQFRLNSKENSSIQEEKSQKIAWFLHNKKAYLLILLPKSKKAFDIIKKKKVVCIFVVEYFYPIRDRSGSPISGSSSTRLGLSTPVITSSSILLYVSDVSEFERFLFCLKSNIWSLIKKTKQFQIKNIFFNLQVGVNW